MEAGELATIVVIHGPNLNLLGRREPEIYGSTTLAEIDARLSLLAAQAGHTLKTFQSNHEGAIVDRIQDCMGRCEGLIINPGAYTHTSVAIRDAVSGVQVPTIEVHLSNVFAREEFRHHSYLTPVAKGIISGFGAIGYELALQVFVEQFKGERI